MPAAMIVRVIMVMMLMIVMMVVAIVHRAADSIGTAFGRKRCIDRPHLPAA